MNPLKDGAYWRQRSQSCSALTDGLALYQGSRPGLVGLDQSFWDPAVNKKSRVGPATPPWYLTVWLSLGFPIFLPHMLPASFPGTVQMPALFSWTSRIEALSTFSSFQRTKPWVFCYSNTNRLLCAPDSFIFLCFTSLTSAQIFINSPSNSLKSPFHARTLNNQKWTHIGTQISESRKLSMLRILVFRNWQLEGECWGMPSTHQVGKDYGGPELKRK